MHHPIRISKHIQNEIWARNCKIRHLKQNKKRKNKLTDDKEQQKWSALKVIRSVFKIRMNALNRKKLFSTVLSISVRCSSHSNQWNFTTVQMNRNVWWANLSVHLPNGVSCVFCVIIIVTIIVHNFWVAPIYSVQERL